MTPPFACVPVCWLFAALFLLGVLMYAIGAGRSEQPESESPPTGPPVTGRVGPPPWWVIVLIFAAVIGGLLLLSLVNADY
jgi:hypothetical protein